MPNEKATPPLREKSKPRACPFSTIDETSQVLRRRDLVALGDTFKTALSPISTLVHLMQLQNTNSVELLKRMEGQATRMDRLQQLMFYLLGLALVVLVVQIGVVLSIRQVVGQVGSTATELEAVASTVQPRVKVVVPPPHSYSRHPGSKGPQEAAPPQTAIESKESLKGD